MERRFKEIKFHFEKNPRRKVRGYLFPKLIDLINLNENEYLESLEILQNIQGLKTQKYSLRYELKHSKESRIYVNSISVIVKGKVFVEVKRHVVNNKIVYNLTSQLIAKKYLKANKIDNIDLHFRGLVFDTEITESSTTNSLRSNRLLVSGPINVSELLLDLLEGLVSDVQDEFESSSINYVNPLRAFPKRYYFLDDANVSTSLNSMDGDNLTEILKKNTLIKDKVNKWLNKFHISVTVEDLKDIIHKLKIKHYGVNLDITDVGFGISQILPILVQGFLSNPNSLTIIEQPEIHLHPKMQADLADLFIDIVTTKGPVSPYFQSNENNRIVIIETHSEYLLKRLRRRISEGKIKSEDVGLYFVHSKTSRKKYAEIKRIKINSKGGFNWPNEFYSTDLEDTVEFIKNQN